MNDIKLIRELMQKEGWKQFKVAEFVGLNSSQISRILKKKQSLHPSAKKLISLRLEGKI